MAQARALIDDDPMAVRENFRLADEFGRRAVALDATDGEAWATAARISALILRGKYEMTPERRETAKTQVERAGRLAPDSIETGLALATYLEVNEDSPTAEQMLRRLLQRAPADKRLWRSLATNLWNNGRHDDALAALRQPAGLLEEDPEAQALLGSVLSALGRFREGEAVLERVLRRSPTKMAYYYQLVLQGFYRSDLAEASRLLEKVPPQLMQEDGMINSAAEIWLRLGEGDKALKVLQKSPRDFLEEGFEVRPKGFLTGAALQQAGRPTAALAEWRQALVVVEKRLAGNPNQPLLLYWQAVLQALTGQKAAALETRKLYRELEAKPNAWFDAILLVAVGENEQAIQGLEQAWPTASVSMRSEIRGELLYGPWLTSIRADPRMQRLIAEQSAAIERDRAGPVAAVPPVDDKSVAVLAFTNLADDKANEYFSDGISEELLNVLAKVPGLKVSARTSAFYFKGKEVPIPEIAKQLGVAYVVEGSVRKAGEKVRITAQLIKASDGFHVWSDTFTRDLKDVFAVQDEIAGLIAQNLRLTMGASAPGAKIVVNPEAFELYVEARQAWNLRTLEGFDRAEGLLIRALALEPGFARAHAALSDVWGTRGSVLGETGQFGQRESPLMRRIIATAERAVALDPNSAEARASLGNAYTNSWRLTEAARTLRHAVALNPNYATAHQFLGRTLLTQGYFEDAAAELARAAELDPLSHRIIDNYAIALAAMGRPIAALAATERALALMPDSVQAAIWRARCLAKLGRHEDAVSQARRVKEDGGPQSVYLVEVFAAAGLKSEAEEILAKLDRKFVGWRFVGLLELGRYEEALAAMDPAAMSPQSFYQANLDPIRDEPRFKQLLATLGLTEADARMQAWRKAHPPEQPEAKK
ncbi:MAG: tetratricopeptide repeat protein [Lacunisphaera sp.]|nr:tetratricopeptide repeat protein [Lacunisphaera sp.]